jgi:hypothetical protein
MFDLELFTFHVGFLGILVFLDYISTSIAYKMASKNAGAEKAMGYEISPMHRWFWKHFGYALGHKLSTISEYAALIAISSGIWPLIDLAYPFLNSAIFSKREVAIYAYGAVVGVFFFVIIFNFKRYFDEKTIYEKNAASEPKNPSF